MKVTSFHGLVTCCLAPTHAHAFLHGAYGHYNISRDINCLGVCRCLQPHLQPYALTIWAPGCAVPVRPQGCS